MSESFLCFLILLIFFVCQSFSMCTHDCMLSKLPEKELMRCKFYWFNFLHPHCIGVLLKLFCSSFLFHRTDFLTLFHLILIFFFIRQEFFFGNQFNSFRDQPPFLGSIFKKILFLFFLHREIMFEHCEFRWLEKFCFAQTHTIKKKYINFSIIFILASVHYFQNSSYLRSTFKYH